MLLGADLRLALPLGGIAAATAPADALFVVASTVLFELLGPPCTRVALQRAGS